MLRHHHHLCPTHKVGHLGRVVLRQGVGSHESSALSQVASMGTHPKPRGGIQWPPCAIILMRTGWETFLLAGGSLTNLSAVKTVANSSLGFQEPDTQAAGHGPARNTVRQGQQGRRHPVMQKDQLPVQTPKQSNARDALRSNTSPSAAGTFGPLLSHGFSLRLT